MSLVHKMNKRDKVFKNRPSKICGGPKQTLSLQTSQRLSSTNFTWAIIEYFDQMCLLKAITNHKKKCDAIICSILASSRKLHYFQMPICDCIFKNGLTEICGLSRP